MPRKFVCTLSKEELEHLYINEGKTLSEMCEVVGVKSPITMSKILKQKGISTDRNSRVSNETRRGMSDDDFKSYLASQYETRSINEIAEVLGVTQNAIRKYFKKYGIAFKGHQDVKGDANPNWNGGRHIHNGYIEVYMPDHPRKNKRNCIYEHQHVMEQHIGRYLQDGEVVHHKDFCKTNNAIENLQLMTNSEHMSLHSKIRWNKGE